MSAIKRLSPVEFLKKRTFYGNVIVAAAMGNMLLIHGGVNTFGVFFTPLLNQFGSSRAALSFANSLAFFVMGCLAILMGALADRFGPRRVMTACVIFFGTGFLLMSWASSLGQVYLFFVLIGIGFSASDVVPLTMAVRWFNKKRGIMSGMMKVGTGSGMMIMPLVAATLISHFGWQESYKILGIVTLIVTIPLIQLMRREPAEMDLLPDGASRPDVKVPLPKETGLTLKEALRTKQMWLISAFYFTILYCGSTVLVHTIPRAIDAGVAPEAAAAIISIFGASSIAGRLIMGYSGDRIGHKKGLIICFLIMITALTWLQFANNLWGFYLFAAIYGFNHGGFFSLVSPLVASLFGTRSQGPVLGIIIFCGTIGSSTGSVLSGHIYDVTGSYRIAFLILLGMAITGLTLVSLVKPIRNRDSGETNTAALQAAG